MTVLVSMPEAAIDKNHSFVLFENQVGFTGQFFVMEPVSESL